MVKIENISKTFKKVQALNNVSFHAEKGELFGIIGPDGAGKTTLFRIMTTLTIPDNGTVLINNRSIFTDYMEIRKNIGYMPGKFALYQDLTVEENLNFFASVFNITIKENYHLIKGIYSHIAPFKTRKAGMKMNGINNIGLFSNQTANKDGAAFIGNLAGVNRRAQSRRAASDSKQTNTDKDTYEYSGQTRDVKAGYSRPKKTESTEYKPLDSNGIQEGIELSDAAKTLLAELREKYGNMDISVAEWSTDEEQDYYAEQSDKDYSVLINPELLEKMAADPAEREKYEKVLSGAGDQLDTLKEELGEDADKIKGFSITMDKDGNVSYAVKLLKDLEANSKAQKERISERRAERKKAEEEREERVVKKKLETEKVEASSIEELVAAIKKKLHPEQAETDQQAKPEEEL